jgi:tetratricopeptide (TPR) repeat protein
MGRHGTWMISKGWGANPKSAIRNVDGGAMKKAFLAGAFLGLMAIAAEAQVIIDYTRTTRKSSLHVTYSAGSYSGFGYGGYYGGLYGGGYPGAFTYYAAGSGIPVNGMPMTAPYPLYPPPGAFYSGYGLYSYGTPGGLYGGGAYRSPYGMPPVTESLPMPPRPGGVADRLHELASAKQIEIGRARFRAGDYKGALDDFRAAVVADTSSGRAQAHFAIALVVTGDLRNADKALRAAAEHAPFGKVEFADLFAGEKERARVTAALGKVSGDGALAAAYALLAMGDAERLKKLSEKDPAAKKLLP